MSNQHLTVLKTPSIALFDKISTYPTRTCSIFCNTSNNSTFKTICQKMKQLCKQKQLTRWNWLLQSMWWCSFNFFWLKYVWLYNSTCHLEYQNTTCFKGGCGYGAMKLANHSSGHLLRFWQEVMPLKAECFWQRVKMRMENYNFFTNIGHIGVKWWEFLLLSVNKNVQC